jgi:hypothetical protein
MAARWITNRKRVRTSAEAVLPRSGVSDAS